MAVGEHEVLRSSLWLQPDRNVGDAVVEAGEAAEKVDGEGPGGALHVHRQLMGARRRLDPDMLDLLQQVAHRQDFVLLAAHRPGAHAGDALQVAPGLDKTQYDSTGSCRLKVDFLYFLQLPGGSWVIIAQSKGLLCVGPSLYLWHSRPTTQKDKV